MTPRALTLDLNCERAYLRDLGRAFGGALLFNIPLLMTEEMWIHGIAADRGRLLAFVLGSLPLLYGLAYYAGFSARRGLLNNLLDTLVALAVGAGTAAAMLLMFGIVAWDTPPREWAGHIGLQTVPGAIGALLARRQMSQGTGDDGDEDSASYAGELFLMLAGALFFGFNLAPTGEMMMLAYSATAWHLLAIIVLSVSLLHVIVFKAGFAGEEDQGQPVAAFLHYTLPGYAIALAGSLLTLWVFGRTEDHALSGVVSAVVVLGFPASVGAAAARLLV